MYINTVWSKLLNEAKDIKELKTTKDKISNIDDEISNSEIWISALWNEIIERNKKIIKYQEIVNEASSLLSKEEKVLAERQKTKKQLEERLKLLLKKQSEDTKKNISWSKTVDWNLYI